MEKHLILLFTELHAAVYKSANYNFARMLSRMDSQLADLKT